MPINSSARSSGCTRSENLRALASDWLPCSGSSSGTVAVSGLKRPWGKAQLSISRLADRRHPCPKLPRNQRGRYLAVQRSGEQISLAVLTLEGLEILALLRGL